MHQTDFIEAIIYFVCPSAEEDGDNIKKLSCLVTEYNFRVVDNGDHAFVLIKVKCSTCNENHEVVIPWL